MKLHPSHRSAIRSAAIVLPLLALGMLVAWLLPPLPQLRGVANYLPLHTFLEAVSIVIAALVFAVSWNAYSEKLPGNVVLLGCVFLGVALIDFSHTLSFAGMPDFVTPSDPEKAIDFWLVARLLAAGALLAVALLPWRPLASATYRYGLLGASLLLVFVVNWLVLLWQDQLPHTFVPGSGLTAFKIGTEYFIIALCLAAAIQLWRLMREPQSFNAAALFGAVCTMAMSEFLFTLYADVTDIFNLLGHVYKAISYLFIYRAIFVTTVESPYRQLSASQAKLQATLDALPDLLFEVDGNGRFYDFNAPKTEMLAVPPETFLGRTVAEVMPPDAVGPCMAAILEAQEAGLSIGAQYALQLPHGLTWFELSVARKDEAGQEPRYVVLSRDITERKRSEDELKKQSQLYAALSRCNEAIVRSNSIEELLPAICRDVVEAGGMKLAWVALPAAESKHLVAAYAYGHGSEALKDFRVSFEGEGVNSSPVAQAMRDDRPFWCQDYQRDPATARWHEYGARFGLGAAAALPLHLNGKVIGSFNLYAAEVDAFDKEVQQLLHEMAMDIDFALHNFEREKQRTRAEAALEESRNLFRTVIDTAPVRIFWKDNELRYLGCNPSFAHDAGMAKPEDLIGKDDHQMGWREQAELYRADDRRVMDTGMPKLSFDEPQTTPDGKTIWLRTSKVPLHDAGGGVSGVLGIYEDITDRKRAEIALQRSERDLNRAQAIAHVGSWTFDVATSTFTGSEEAYRLYGFEQGSMVPLDEVLAVVHAEDRKMFEVAFSEAVAGAILDIEYRIVVAGETRWMSSRGEAEAGLSGQTVAVIGTSQDITEHMKAEERIHHLAHFDTLTGLPNRIQLEERLKYAISMARRANENIALMFIDLDRFKDINDTLGHSIGDGLLVQLAQRLRQTLRDQDVVSRLGGDEFVVMLPATEMRGATQVVQKLLEVSAQPYHVEQYDLNLTASVGIAIYPGDGTDLESLSRSADTAMYRAKQDGRNCFRFFTAEMQERSARNLRLVNDLRNALHRNQLHLVYQPQLAMDGRIIGAESLLRWQHPELGPVSPVEFIPLAEDSGLILSIGEWVMRRAVHQAKAWLDNGVGPLIMAVNLSAVQFRHANLPDMVSRILDEEGLPPEYLELELTEGAAMHDPHGAIAMMNNLHERGVRLSLDDFGTGYSSLSYLKKFKVYKLKIDQSFVRDISTDPEDKAIVTTVINVAKSLGLKTIAEGVETEGQLAFLREQGCEEVQGYYYSKPLPPAQFEEFARARSAHKAAAYIPASDGRSPL